MVGPGDGPPLRGLAALLVARSLLRPTNFL